MARRIAGTILAALAAIALDAAAQDVPLEHAVKAAFVPKFAPYVQWPADASVAQDAPIVICVAGNDAVGKLLEESAKGQTHLGRPITVRTITAPTGVEQCQILYVAGLRDETIAAYLDAARGRPVLTVTDAGDDRKPRGVIDFAVRGNRVRFDIDLVAAAQQRVVVSSKLLTLAMRVRPLP